MGFRADYRYAGAMTMRTTVDHRRDASRSLIGVGLYTPAEAGRLIQVPPEKIARWLRGHDVGDHRYDALWHPQITLDDGTLFLGFRDLQEARVAAAFIDTGLSPQRIRKAIDLARNMTGEERPLSTTRFRTDGRTVFLQIAAEDGQTRLIDLFSSQFAFREIVERSLRHVEFDGTGAPMRWWPLGRKAAVVIDPTRSFGQAIEVETSVPAATLAAAATAEGSVEAAARVWAVPLRAVKRAVAYEQQMATRAAA